MKRSAFIYVLTLFLGLSLSACSGGGWFGEEEEPPLPGERVSILELQQELQPEATDEAFNLPEPWQNEFWPQTGGYPNHSMQNLALNPDKLEQIWRADIGSGGSGNLPLTAQPIIAEGKVFTLDTESQLSAFDSKNGERLWRVSVAKPTEDDTVIGGGISSAGGVLYVTAGYDEVLAVSPENGEIFWRTHLKAPARAAPTIMNGRVFVSTLLNDVYAVDAKTGRVMWEYAGIGETTGILGAASPAANSDIVVAGFSSGDLHALRVENGSVAWSENLADVMRLSGLAGLSDIRGLPVMDKGLVIAISFGGKIAAIEERTGVRVWQKEISGSETPWVAGNRVFVLSSSNQLVSLSRESGDINWITQLKQFDNAENRSGPIFWTGPVLAGGRLIASGSGGRIAEINPETGKLVRQWSMGKTVRLPMAVANGTLYMLSEDGTLLAYR